MTLYTYVGAALLAMAMGFSGGWKTRAWKAGADDAARAEQVASDKAAAAEQVDAASAVFEKKLAAANARVRATTKKANQIVQAPVYRVECVDADGLRLLADDAAASNARRKLETEVPAASSPE